MSQKERETGRDSEREYVIEPRQTQEHRPGVQDAVPALDAVALRILARPEPTERVRRLSFGDPLRLQERCAARLRERALFLNLERLRLRTVARIALGGPCASDSAGGETWLEARIDEAVDDLVRKPRQISEQRANPRREEDAAESPFGPEHVLHGLSAAWFNALDDEARRAFFAVFIDGDSIDGCLAAGLGPPSLLRKRLRRACQALLDELPVVALGSSVSGGEELS